MQQKSYNTRIFLDRANALAVRNGLSTSALCRTIGISRSLFYDIKDGQRDATEKMLGRLRDAEAACSPQAAPPAVEEPHVCGGVEARIASLEDAVGQARRTLETVLAEVREVRRRLGAERKS